MLPPVYSSHKAAEIFSKICLTCQEMYLFASIIPKVFSHCFKVKNIYLKQLLYSYHSDIMSVTFSVVSLLELLVISNLFFLAISVEKVIGFKDCFALLIRILRC